MQYNSQRPQLIISEYGRHIQEMVNHAMTIEDREERNKIARYIISVMGQLNPQLRDAGDFRHKLWDHLFIMSDFRLDVDSPYPIPSRESFNTKPEKLAYPSQSIKFRHYGKIIERIIEQAKDMEEGPARDALVSSIAHHLKKSYLLWNRDSVEDEQIFQDLGLLSDGKLKPSESIKLPSATEMLGPQSFSQQQGKKFQRKPQKQNKFKRKFGGNNSY